MCSLDGRSWTDTGIIPMDEVGGKVPRSTRAVKRTHHTLAVRSEEQSPRNVCSQALALSLLILGPHSLETLQRSP